MPSHASTIQRPRLPSPALHCAQHCTARSATQRPALHSVQRYTAPSATQRPALHSAQRYTAAALRQCSNDSKRFRKCARLHLLSAQRIYSAQRSIALHSAQRCVAQCAYCPPPALHSAQHCTAPSKALHPAQRAKTRPIAASEPSRLRKGGLLRFFLFG